MARSAWGHDPGGAPRIVALLGPTNTGKTHRAIERMLEHDSGMMGLPLRLLAREVYDRVTARVGENLVALVTGEEQRVPPAPRFWICTVEAMPLDVPADFLAVDEIQLAGDPNRGHVFTDRLLHARGRRETWFMGAATIAPLIARLVPEAELASQPRLSRLAYLGHRRIGGLPRRTAVVAFSAERVYELAERVRRRHGGAAVVLGALSPRARNAQVAMFQSGEVPYLVATDAIGMGLNMDVEHVAFAELRKFDGARVRHLQDAEVAQIAGRAGRHVADGTFGPTEGAPELAPSLVGNVEGHRFPPLRALWWRSRELDFGSLPALHASLVRPPPSRALLPAPEDDDLRALRAVMLHADVRARARRPDDVALLWELCRIPDYRRRLDDSHPQLLRHLYARLQDHGHVAGGWIERQVASLRRVDGDIAELMARLAAIRTWTYVSHRRHWVEGARAVAEHARAVEDMLSDALHEQLTARFVDRRAGVALPAAPGRVEGDEVRVGGVRVGRLEGLSFQATFDGAVPRGVREALDAETAERVQALVDAPHAAFALGDDLVVRWRGGAVARLVGGPDVREPTVKLLRNDLLGPGGTVRVQRRMAAWARDFVAGVLAPLRPQGLGAGPARGLLWQLEGGLGKARAEDARDTVAALDARDRRRLGELGVRFGVGWVYALPMLERGADCARLWAAFAGMEAVAAGDEGLLLAAGSIAVGPRAFRVDEYEAVTAKLRMLARGGAFVAPGELGEDPAPVLEALGYARAGDRWVRAARRERRAG